LVDSPRDGQALLIFETEQFADVFLDLVPTDRGIGRAESLIVETLIPVVVGHEGAKDHIG
jgi:hypothetical protein